MVMSFFSLCIVMLVSYIIITVKLKQRNSVFTASTNDVNTKITRASWLTLGAFIILYSPSIILSLVPHFIPKPIPIILFILLDITYLLYYLNNVINPFLYFATLSDFKEGYTCFHKNLDKVSDLDQFAFVRLNRPPHSKLTGYSSLRDPLAMYALFMIHSRFI